MVCLYLQGLPGPIEFSSDTAHMSDALRSVLVGWPALAEQEGAKSAPVLRVGRRGREIRVERLEDYWTASEPTEVSAICTLVVELVNAHVRAAPKLGSLHAAAAEFAGRLVVLPATHRAGKSTLMARLAARGRRVFADDLLPVDLETGEAVATGCLPRLRLPLPRASAAILTRHVRKGAVLSDGYYCYVQPGPRAIVRHGDRARVGAFVVLERTDRARPPRLVPIPAEDALQALLVQNTNDRLAAGTALRGYLEMLGEAPAFRLSYFGIEDAASTLETAFASWPAPAARRSAPVAPAPQTAATIEPPPVAGPGPLYRRNPHVALNPVGSAGFLVDSERNGVHRLNAIGLGLWNLLATPLDEETIVSIFAGAFPDVEPSSIREDVARLLAELSGRQLLEKV